MAPRKTAVLLEEGDLLGKERLRTDCRKDMQEVERLIKSCPGDTTGDETGDMPPRGSRT